MSGDLGDIISQAEDVAETADLLGRLRASMHDALDLTPDDVLPTLYRAMQPVLEAARDRELAKEQG